MAYIKGKTAAIREASRHVGMPVKTGAYSWQVTGPWDSSKPNGATTTIQRSSYWSALEKRSAWVSDVALCLMGASAEARYHADYLSHSCQRYTARALVDKALHLFPITRQD